MIVWSLRDNGTGARFVLPEDNNGDAFVWISQSNNNIFDKTAKVVDDGDLMWLFDRHKSKASKANQEYTIRIMWNGKIYGTSTFRGKNPVIINR